MLFNLIGIDRARSTTSYLEQANRAIPYVRRGTWFAIAAFSLSLFGLGKPRLILIAFTAVLLVYWYLILESIY